MKKNKLLLEVACFNIQSAIIAQEAGADRVELCGKHAEGGTTPGYDIIKTAREQLSIPLHIMIRPRGGDFLYSDMEFDIMKQDIAWCKKIQADGVVFGILDAHGHIDKKRNKELVELARPLSVTFHRAFDLAPDPPEALEAIIECSFDRLLSSGQQPTAIEGISLLSQLVQQAQQRIIIMPGGDVRPNNIAELAQKTKALEFHTAALQKPGISLFPSHTPNSNDIANTIPAVDKGMLQAMKQQLDTSQTK